jgi:glycosyltransferase involved in cell wall biosynthesis
MNILIATPYFYPAISFGGTPKAAYELAKSLSKNGCKVRVLTSDVLDFKYRITNKRNKDIEGIEEVIYHRNISHKLASRYKFCWPHFGFDGEIEKQCKWADVVHCQELRTPQNIFVLKYVKKYYFKLFLTPHGSLPYLGNQVWAKQLYDSLWGKRFLESIDHGIALSKKEKEQFISMGIAEDKVEIIPNGINFEEMRASKERFLSIKERFNLGKGKIILYIGRINRIKGLDFLLRSFARIVNNFDNINLIIAGPDDGELSNLIKLAKELDIYQAVRFIGPIYDEDKYSFMSGCDVFVYPSSYENFPLAPLEAVFCGSRVIMTEGNDVGELLEKNNLAQLIKFGDEISLSQLILKNLSEGIKENRSQDSIEDLKSMLNWDSIAKRTIKQYEESIRNEK